MRSDKSTISKILFAFLCSIAIAACAPVQTGSLDREYSAPQISPESSLETAEWQQNFLSGMPSPRDAGEEGRSPDDGEPEPEKTRDQEIKDLEKLGKWEEGVPAAEEAGEVVKYDFPVTVNRQVEYYLEFFTGKHREHFAVWLSRSGRYLPMIREELHAAGLPEDLAYLAMIESGYKERAYSRAKAVGMWQFIKSTGRKYGLTINNYVDERRNPTKSTQAAVAYLNDLYREFGSWYLAVAAYNAGEGKIRRAIKKYGTTDFWEIAQGEYLKLETKRYVPKLIAAIIIAKEPAKYGFTDIVSEPGLAYDEVEVPRWTSIKAVALSCNMEPEDLKKYNNELSKGFTPPDMVSYPFRVPPGKKDEVERNLPRVQAIVSTEFKTHQVRKGETLNSICKKYGLTKTVVLKSNNLGAAGLQAGQRLRIPYQTTSYKMLPEGTVARGYLAAESAGGNFILHKILPGETISELSRRYSVPVYLIAAWNDLGDIGRIRAGQQLVFYVQGNQVQDAAASAESGAAGRQILAESLKVAVAGQEAPPQPAKAQHADVRTVLQRSEAAEYYVVKTGDSLWNIARKHDLRIDEIMQLNGMEDNIIRPGDRLLVSNKARSTAAAAQYYQVRQGDSLWSIAKNYNAAPEDIIRWNNLKDDTIHPGDRMLVRPAAASETGVDTYYQVRRGDSLWAIARIYNVAPEDIIRWNNLKDNTIHPGNRLLLKIAKGG